MPAPFCWHCGLSSRSSRNFPPTPSRGSTGNGAAWQFSASEYLEREETRELVRASIDRLPEDSRDVLLLRDIEGWDTQETADQLGIKPGAVKTRLHRARQALRTLLDPHLRGPQ